MSSVASSTGPTPKSTAHCGMRRQSTCTQLTWRLACGTPAGPRCKVYRARHPFLPLAPLGLPRHSGPGAVAYMGDREGSEYTQAGQWGMNTAACPGQGPAVYLQIAPPPSPLVFCPRAGATSSLVAINKHYFLLGFPSRISSGTRHGIFG